MFCETDLRPIALEAASQYIIQIVIKPVIYSIKLKLEFVILGKLRDFIDNQSHIPTSLDHHVTVTRSDYEARTGPQYVDNFRCP